MMKRLIAQAIFLVIVTAGTANALLSGPRRAVILTGGVHLSWFGPSSGTVSLPSTTFTVVLNGAQFNGLQTVTISDNGEGGTITPSIGSPGTDTVTVTPANHATGFTFTFTPASTGIVTLTLTNGQKWTNPSNLTYNSQTPSGCSVNVGTDHSLSTGCQIMTSMIMGFGP
jgi:hypothetical protein